MTTTTQSASPDARPYVTADLLTPIGDGEAALKLLDMLGNAPNKVEPVALTLITDGLRASFGTMRKIVAGLEAQPLPTPDAMDRMRDRLSALEAMTGKVKAARTAPAIDRNALQQRLHEVVVLAMSADETLDGAIFATSELLDLTQRATRAHTLVQLIVKHASSAIEALETPASKEAAQ